MSGAHTGVLIFSYMAVLAAGCADGTDEHHVSPDALVLPECRVSVTQAVTESSSTDPMRSGKRHRERTCAFDLATNTLACEYLSTETGDRSTSVATWASREDAVAENYPIGRLRLASLRVDYERPVPADAPREAFLNGPCAYTSSVTYASDGRPLSAAHKPDDERCRESSILYSDWDDAGRPLRGVAMQMTSQESGFVKLCGESHVTLSYDDDNRTSVADAAADPDCEDSRERIEYNADHIQLTSQFEWSGITSTTETTIQAVETICK
jgi:hypothetical protein